MLSAKRPIDPGDSKMRVIIAITGASGAIYGFKMLQALHDSGVETHFVISDAAQQTASFECDYSEDLYKPFATFIYGNDQLGASIASGSFVCDAMIVIPCSMKTLAAIATGVSGNLIARAADVMIKEKRKLILCPRETPLSSIHLRNMLTLSDMGVQIIPPIPAFYGKPATLEDIISHHVMKIFDALQLPYQKAERWKGL